MDTKNQQQTGVKLIRVLVFTLICSVMSVTMFNIVLPQISEEFNLTIAQVSWVTSAYTMIYAIGVVTYGKLADIYKLKGLVTYGMLFLALGSLIGLIAQTFWMVLVGRCIQAVGAAVIPAIAMLIPVRYFKVEQRGGALGLVAVGLALGTALGPVISALIVSVVNWRWLFSISLLTLITLPFYRKYLGNEHGKSGKLDWIGGAFLGATVTMILLGFTNDTWWFIIGGLLSFILFIARIRSISYPFIQPRLFKIKGYSIIITISFLVSGIGFSLSFLSPLLLADVQELTPNWIGFTMVPAATTAAILGRKGGKLADKKGNSYLFFIASGTLLCSFVLLSTFSWSSPLFIAIFLIFGNVGQSFMMITLSNTTSTMLQREQVGVGMGLLSMMNFIAGSVAAVIYGKAVDMGSNFHLNLVNVSPNDSIYSNIYFILAILYVVIMTFYYLQFSKEEGKYIQAKT